MKIGPLGQRFAFGAALGLGGLWGSSDDRVSPFWRVFTPLAMAGIGFAAGPRIVGAGAKLRSNRPVNPIH